MAGLTGYQGLVDLPRVYIAPQGSDAANLRFAWALVRQSARRLRNELRGRRQP